MAESLPLRKDDLELLEQMIETVKFKELLKWDAAKSPPNSPCIGRRGLPLHGGRHTLSLYYSQAESTPHEGKTKHWAVPFIYKRVIL